MDAWQHDRSCYEKQGGIEAGHLLPGKTVLPGNIVLPCKAVHGSGIIHCRHQCNITPCWTDASHCLLLLNGTINVNLTVICILKPNCKTQQPLQHSLPILIAGCCLYRAFQVLQVLHHGITPFQAVIMAAALPVLAFPAVPAAKLAWPKVAGQSAAWMSPSAVRLSTA